MKVLEVPSDSGEQQSLRNTAVAVTKCLGQRVEGSTNYVTCIPTRNEDSLPRPTEPETSASAEEKGVGLLTSLLHSSDAS